MPAFSRETLRDYLNDALSDPDTAREIRGFLYESIPELKWE